MMLRVFQVDAFTSKPFSGNYAAVVLVPPGSALSDELRQRIAAEMNLPETAFVELPGAPQSADPFAGCSTFGLRWFTPETEVPLCGHATLASAAVLFQECGNQSALLRFNTLQSGELCVSRQPSQSGGPLLMEMSLPLADPSAPLPAALGVGSEQPGPDGPEEVMALRSANPRVHALLTACVGKLRVGAVRYAAELKYLLLELEGGTSRAQLEAISPDFTAMTAAATKDDIHGVIVTAAGDPGSGYAVLSRFFAPWCGIPEDPVTGSAHCVLAPHWVAKLGGGRAGGQLMARQCSPRGGDVGMRLDPAHGRVYVSGPAVVVLRGVLEF